MTVTVPPFGHATSVRSAGASRSVWISQRDAFPNRMLCATGSFTVEGGSLIDDWAQPYGSIYEILFEVDPRILADLSTGFSGRSNISLAPVPEPVAIVLLAFGIGGLALRRRR